jgi:hypothetical protein
MKTQVLTCMTVLSSRSTPIKAVSNIVFGIFVALKLCKPTPPSWGYDLEGQPGTSRSTPGPLPGSARAEAERRR